MRTLSILWSQIDYFTHKDLFFTAVSNVFVERFFASGKKINQFKTDFVLFSFIKREC